MEFVLSEEELIKMGVRKSEIDELKKKPEKIVLQAITCDHITNELSYVLNDNVQLFKRDLLDEKSIKLVESAYERTRKKGDYIDIFSSYAQEVVDEAIKTFFEDAPQFKIVSDLYEFKEQYEEAVL